MLLACLLDETPRDPSCTCRQTVNQYPSQMKGYSSLGKTSLSPSSNRCRKGRPYSLLCTFFLVTHPQHSSFPTANLTSVIIAMRCKFSKMTLHVPSSVANLLMHRRQTATLTKMPAELCAAYDSNQHICKSTCLEQTGHQCSLCRASCCPTQGWLQM